MPTGPSRPVSIEPIQKPPSTFGWCGLRGESSEQPSTHRQSGTAARAPRGRGSTSVPCRCSAAGARQERTQSPACQPRAKKAQVRRVGKSPRSPIAAASCASRPRCGTGVRVCPCADTSQARKHRGRTPLATATDGGRAVHLVVVSRTNERPAGCSGLLRYFSVGTEH